MLKRIRLNHITPILRELHWLRIHDRIIYKILLLTHKAVNTTAPEYLCDLIRLNVKSTTIRTCASFEPGLLCVPPISKTCANSFFDRSFVYAAPTLWNAIDLDIRFLPFDTFEKYGQDIGGSALRLIRSYFSDRTQRVQIDSILSDFAKFVVWGAFRAQFWDQ